MADDTAAIQLALNSSNYTLPVKPGGYFISSTITVRHNFNLNGQTVTYTALTQRALLIPVINTHITISNGTLIGTSNASNPNGNIGIDYEGDYSTIDHLTISNFTAYAILANNANHPTITNNTITRIGYIAISLISSAPITGGLIYNNTIDRTDQLPASISQAAFILRGAVGDTSSNWIIRKNTINMPLSPSAIAAECFEGRYVKNVLIDSNTFNGSSIANSIVRSAFVVSRHNTYLKQSHEALEFADTRNSRADFETIGNQYAKGIFIDGFSAYGGDNTDSVTNCTITTTADNSIEANGVVANIYIANNTLSTRNVGIRLQKANNFTIQNNTMTGNGVGTNAIYLDNSTGNVSLACGAMTGFINKPLHIYGSTPIVTANVSLTNFSSTTTGYSTYLTGGATVSAITVTPVPMPTGCTSGSAPIITYANQSFTALTTISPVNPTNTGGTPSGYSISPALPSGLSFNTTTGVITGTPTPYQTAVIYTVIASNLIGADTTTFTIAIANPAFTFGSLPTKTYGNADFSPGATSPASIGYTSSNLSVAVVTGGQIHIVNSGSSTITADNGYQTIPQTLTVNKAVLTITANNKARPVGTANPLLTVAYSGFVNNEDHTVLTSQPTISTTANIGSPVGAYPITPSAATAPNYSFVYVDGTMYVFNDLGPLIYNGKLIIAY